MPPDLQSQQQRAATALDFLFLGGLAILVAIAWFCYSQGRDYERSIWQLKLQQSETQNLTLKLENARLKSEVERATARLEGALMRK